MREIKSTLNSVADRQRSYGFDIKRLDVTADNINYWTGHLIEELCEFNDSGYDPKEAADVIIFLQNLMAVLAPLSVVTVRGIKTSKYTTLCEVIFALRKSNAFRKDWKVYKKPTTKELADLLSLIISYIFWFSDPDEVIEAYFKKEEFNKTRADWQRSNK